MFYLFANKGGPHIVLVAETASAVEQIKAALEWGSLAGIVFALSLSLALDLYLIAKEPCILKSMSMDSELFKNKEAWENLSKSDGMRLIHAIMRKKISAVTVPATIHQLKIDWQGGDPSPCICRRLVDGGSNLFVCICLTSALRLCVGAGFINLKCLDLSSSQPVSAKGLTGKGVLVHFLQSQLNVMMHRIRSGILAAL